MTDVRPDVAVVADDLIWASRLTAAVDKAGFTARRITAARLGAELEAHEPGAAAVGPRAATDPGGAQRGPGALLVDLGDGRGGSVDLIARAAAAGWRVLAVAQHDDTPLRKDAISAGASRVFSYNRFFSRGPELIASWLAEERPR